jgi:hypothetical protein
MTGHAGNVSPPVARGDSLGSTCTPVAAGMMQVYVIYLVILAAISRVSG